MVDTTLLICDGENGCGKEFRVARPSVDYLAGGVEKRYFRCPHCQKVYVLFYTDGEIRKKQAAIRRVADPDMFRQMRQEIAADMAELRKRFEK